MQQSENATTGDRRSGWMRGARAHYIWIWTAAHYERTKTRRRHSGCGERSLSSSGCKQRSRHEKEEDCLRACMFVFHSSWKASSRLLVSSAIQQVGQWKGLAHHHVCLCKPSQLATPQHTTALVDSRENR